MRQDLFIDVFLDSVLAISAISGYVDDDDAGLLTPRNSNAARDGLDGLRN